MLAQDLAFVPRAAQQGVRCAMAIHASTVSLLKESLPEFLEAARYCVGFSKNSGWGQQQVGGCLGYPATALMLSIADTIGSYSSDVAVSIDSKTTNIGSEHFRVFNSTFYSLALTGHVIDKLYQNYRNLLLHNAALANDHILFIDNSQSAPFVERKGKVDINVSGLLAVTSKAVAMFLQQADSIVPGSKAEQNIHAKQ
jgi:hypothetical protein